MRNSFLRQGSFSSRRVFFLVFDSVCSVFSFWIAFLLRFEGNLPQRYLTVFEELVPLILLVRIPIFLYFDFYRPLWQNFGSQELLLLLKGISLGSVLILVISYFLQLPHPPRSILIIDWMFLILLIGGLRLGYKQFIKTRRPFDTKKLFRRELVTINLEKARQYLEDKTVLITGGGGSIGSELARVLSELKLKKLLIVDNNEFNLVEVEEQISKIKKSADVVYLLYDITEKDGLEKLFIQERPNLIFHTAAYKHLPVAQKNYQAVIKNNVFGSKIVADLAQKYSVEKFVFISTDKAVNPHSIMGATKRLGEIYLRQLQSKTTNFITVRFGNVYNSRGSVVPRFIKQISEEKKITITDRRASRYFMDLSEAVGLIIEATIMGRDNEIFVLEMGEPIKIVDLGYYLAESMGLEKDELKLEVVGLRPGEKLEEELVSAEGKLIGTENEKINICIENYQEDRELGEKLSQLSELVSNGASFEKISEKLKELVPEYKITL